MNLEVEAELKSLSATLGGIETVMNLDTLRAEIAWRTSERMAADAVIGGDRCTQLHAQGAPHSAVLFAFCRSPVRPFWPCRHRDGTA